MKFVEGFLHAALSFGDTDDPNAMGPTVMGPTATTDSLRPNAMDSRGCNSPIEIEIEIEIDAVLACLLTSENQNENGYEKLNGNLNKNVSESRVRESLRQVV